ncbi:MAG: glycyl-radical enzyme activating protein [Ruminococcaceae bacterium]|nr:glycyl-radical enzyme activating protein [Oscillospiraceae bacterium]
MNQNILSVSGRIFDIQRFSTHDGPGVRTIVFLKGCPLRCRWCCNPESQVYDIQQMNEKGKLKTVGKDVTVSEVLNEVLRDRPYYRRSFGGVTLSGGECLWQPDFATALLLACKESGINTAIETTGFADTEVVERFIPLVDVFLMDIKHIDSKKHEEFTTRPNEKILENARLIAKKAKKLIIRVPVIPGFNDTKEEIEAIASFASSLDGVNEIHLLPYHRMGQGKYEGLGRPYLMGDTLPPSAEQMQELKAVCEKHRLITHLGG